MKIKAKKQTVIARSVTPMRSIVAMFLVTLLLAACGDDNKNAGGTVEDGEVVAIVDKTISGVSQKGPFVNGSSVTVQELDGKILAQTGLGFEGKIKNDLGEFSVKVNKLESQYALLKANGYYRNEVTGEKSKSQITLYALTDLSKRDEVNVNLLTHLAYERSLYLAMVDTLSVAKAKKQAEVEILNSFGIEGDFAAAEDLNIFGADDQSAALLAMSILMQSDLSEGDFSERLADYAADIESDGIWNDAKTATEIADWANALWLRSGLAIIRENIVKWDLSADVPAFEKYVNNFWWQNYGLGICDAKREGEVLKNQNTASVNADVYYICKSNLWQVASDIEKDTYKWLDLTTKRTEKDGDVRYGDVVATNCYVFEDKAWRSGNANDCSLNLRGCTKLRKDTVGKGSDSVWHVCHNRTWRNATTYEKDTFGWKDSTDGAIKKGNVTDSIYVFDKTAWRVTSNVEAKLGGCVSAIADSVGRVGLTYYICKSNKWIEASAIEYDTYRWTAGKDGDSKVGSVNANNCYVYENKAWRSGNKTDCTLSLRGCTALRQDTVALGSDKVWHICDSKTWRNATTYEKDTFGWKDSTDGAIRKGNETDSAYKYDEISGKWVMATQNDTTLKLMGCTAKRMGEVSMSSADDTYYVCKNRDWLVAQEVEYDTYGEKCTNVNVGKIIAGKVTATNMYYCMANGWVSLMVWDWDVPKEARLNQEITYGTITDNRDGKNYRTVTIGDQTWMAENLNYADSIKTSSLRGKSWCYNNELKNCEVAGRLYTWAAAIDSVKLATDPDNPLDCGSGKTCGLSGMVQGICPSGWHLPDTTEWNVLFLAVGGTPTAGKVLKSQTGWPNNGNGTDSFGFSALPTGYRNYTGSFEIDSGIAFWSSTENNTFNWTSHEMCIIDREDSFLLYTNNNVGLSIRCVKDSV